MDPLCILNDKYSELVMWTLYACLMKTFRIGHVDPLCMFNKNFQSWSRGPSMINKIVRVGHVDPLCMFNENFQSWSYGPSMHV